VGKIRGVESHGMMCSRPTNSGLIRIRSKEDGLLILPEARGRAAFAEYLGRGGSDVVYDLEVTPNRPDLNSVIGIAREIAALTGNPLKLPDVSVASGRRRRRAKAERRWTLSVRMDALNFARVTPRAW
jgi:phenylalanyl-tRNA synthetase beta chain